MKLLISILIVVTQLTTISKSNTAQNIIVYSGNCTYYKRTLTPPNHVTSTPISQAFAKIVINKSARTFNLWYNNKLVLSIDKYDTDMDGQTGQEGFTFYNGSDANRDIATKTFEVNVGMTGGSLGYQYEMTNYKVN